MSIENLSENATLSEAITFLEEFVKDELEGGDTVLSENATLSEVLMFLEGFVKQLTSDRVNELTNTLASDTITEH